MRRDHWRMRAIEVRAEFERNRCAFASFFVHPLLVSMVEICGLRNVNDPRALAVILEKAEADLARKKHPDPCIGVYPSVSVCTFVP